MELQHFSYSGSNEYKPIDSIFISSSTGRTKIKRFKIGQNTGIIMIRRNSLMTNMSINPVSDSIQATYFRRSCSTETIIQTVAAVYGNLLPQPYVHPKQASRYPCMGHRDFITFF